MRGNCLVFIFCKYFCIFGGCAVKKAKNIYQVKELGMNPPKFGMNPPALPNFLWSGGLCIRRHDVIANRGGRGGRAGRRCGRG